MLLYLLENFLSSGSLAGSTLTEADVETQSKQVWTYVTMLNFMSADIQMAQYKVTKT